MLKVLQLGNLIKGQGANFECTQIFDYTDFFEVTTPDIEFLNSLQIVGLAFLDDKINRQLFHFFVYKFD